VKISFVVPPFFQEGRIFSADDESINRDDCLRPFIELRQRLWQHGVHLETDDLLPLEEADAALCLNVPAAGHKIWRLAKLREFHVHVLALESEYIHHPNADQSLFEKCQSVFTYRDDLIDGTRFFPIRFAQRIRQPLSNDWMARKFACMVSGNKASSHPSELYSKRLEIVHWYSDNFPEKFDLYGVGWNSPTPSGLVRRVARKLPWISAIAAPKIAVYRGELREKNELLSQYKFCFCYENFSSPSGWITEKIFDAMFAGCIPVYWGPENTAYHIPAECFINAANYSSPAQLHERLENMRNDDCQSILSSIKIFLSSDRANQFSNETFVATVSDRLCETRRLIINEK
jgi:hypothetical protein